MNVLRTTQLCLLTTFVGLGTMGWGQHVYAQESIPGRQDGVEVLTRGPVHEAFAETISFNPKPGIVISEAPPNPIEEIAPDQRPEGPNVAWIPGYWGWDDERQDFLWISGIWRALPPDRQWIPGYWSQAPDGAQWISGYWADAALNEIEYLPEPPETVEAGPSSAAQSADQIWLPGCWIWKQNRYAWRPGYWAEGNPDWDWVPAHYVWSPRGYVFVDGYYDYSVRRRGLVFAPVYFSEGVRTQRGYSYSPATVINPSVFSRHLFLRPSYGHYYFGDYYGSNYADAGYSPWFRYHSSQQGYDPIYANQRWQHRGDKKWAQRAEANFGSLRENEDARPPRNWAAQAALAEQERSSNRKNSSAVASRLEDLRNRKKSEWKFRHMDAAEQQQSSQRGQDYRNYLQMRQQMEARGAGTPPGDAETAAGPQRRKFSRSPFVAPPADQFRGEQAPPQRHRGLELDARVRPQTGSRGDGRSPGRSNQGRSQRPAERQGNGGNEQGSASAPSQPVPGGNSEPQNSGEKQDKPNKTPKGNSKD